MPVEEGVVFPLKVAYDRTSADIVNPWLADDEGRGPALAYDALEPTAPIAEELLGGGQQRSPSKETTD